MLSARLRERCPSARLAGIASAEAHGINFCKQGLDGSGKASLVQKHGRASISAVQGVLYHIDLAERSNLDRAEGRYDRHDDFTVSGLQTGATIFLSTYIAQPDACSADLLPFDWYVALMIAGAREHQLDPDYIAKLFSVETRKDPDPERAERMARMARLAN